MCIYVLIAIIIGPLKNDNDNDNDNGYNYILKSYII